MAKNKVKLNSQGMRELLRSSAIEQMLVNRMTRAQAMLPGSELAVGRSVTRVRVRLHYGGTFEEAKTGNLSRALDATGGARGTKNVRKKR